MQAHCIDHGNGVYTIDADYVQPGINGFHLMVRNGHGAFFDTGTSHSLSQAKSTMRHLGLSVEDIDYVIPTHVHLDHAGGAGAMVEAFPNAQLVVHPRGKRHLVDPSRLWQGTLEVYGEEKSTELFGKVVPVPEDKVIVADDGFELSFQGQPLSFIDTPGHARHHFCVFDPELGSIFAGDMLGVAYAVLQSGYGHPFAFPSTTPVQFEPEPFHESLHKLERLNARHGYLAHFGRIELSKPVFDDLHNRVDRFVDISLKLSEEEDREPALIDHLAKYLFHEAKSSGCTASDEAIRLALAMDVKLNAQGLDIWLHRRQAG